MLLSSLIISTTLMTSCANSDDVILVSGFTSDNVIRYNASTGDVIDELDQSAGINGALGTTLGPDGLIYVCSELNNRILRFNAQTSTYIDIFISGGNGLNGPTGVVFGLDSTGDDYPELFVASFNSDSILKYNGKTGDFIQTFVTAGDGGLNGPDVGFTFGPDGNLYVPSFWSNQVLKYNGTDGSFMSIFVNQGSAGMLRPRTIIFKPSDGNLLVTCEGSGRVPLYNGETGEPIDVIVSGLAGPTGMALHSDGTLYVASIGEDTVYRYNSETGELIDQLFLPGTGGLDDPTYILLIEKQTQSTELTDVNVVTGNNLNGGLAELLTSDDTYYHTRSGFGQTVVDLHNMEMIVNAVTTVDSASTIDLTIESRIDEPAGLAQIRLRNWNTTQFESVGSYSIGNTDNVDTINGISAVNYVDGGGNIDLSIKHLVFVPFLAFTFESFIDQVEIVVE